jgi:hypothetical protein
MQLDGDATKVLAQVRVEKSHQASPLYCTSHNNPWWTSKRHGQRLRRGGHLVRVGSPSRTPSRGRRWWWVLRTAENLAKKAGS